MDLPAGAQFSIDAAEDANSVAALLDCATAVVDEETVQDSASSGFSFLDDLGQLATSDFSSPLGRLHERLLPEDEMGGYVSRSSSEEDVSRLEASEGARRSESPRRRPAPLSGGGAADFQPIGAEVSEEKAQQLRNEVKRLSPVHVSLRERTLGEISLTSESPTQPEARSSRELVIRLSRVDGRAGSQSPTGETALAADESPGSPCPFGSTLVLERCSLAPGNEALADKLHGGGEIEFSSPGGHPVAPATTPLPASQTEDSLTDDLIARLEQERPEAFTEDSAESLALAAAARDEVRSDGSDSGLGSEMPGDPCPAPAPESDSETSFLDRIPDDILAPDKDKPDGQLEAYTPEVVKTPTTLPSFRTPSKSSLKRRLVDCMEEAEEEPGTKRLNVDDEASASASSGPKKKRNIQFDAVTVYYFPRAQGFTCVPSQGGSTLGMSASHTHAEQFSLSEHAAEQRRMHRARLAQLRSERAANLTAEAASSSEDPSDDTDEEPSDTEELDIDSYYFLQPVPTWQRRALLRAAGVRRIDTMEKDECRDIRASREHCGCGCKGYCDPESCPCSRANVKCQVDRAGFPCGCSRDGCANSSGRIEFNPVRVRTHFIHTLMRLELEKKPHRDEEHQESHHHHHHHQSRLAVPLTSVVDSSGDCLGAGFTGLHYDAQDSGPRSDSLDLYTIRDDCYPNDDCLGDAASQRKLHAEFVQGFQHYGAQGPSAAGFQQNPYADYQTYQSLPSTSRSPFQPQFQPAVSNPGFSHYGSYSQDSSSTTTSGGACHQTHSLLQQPQPQQQQQQQQQQHSNVMYEAPFAQDEVTGSQYTNLNSVQPMNSVVQQIGKLEPFSELLSARYSYYGDVLDQQSHPQQQHHGTYHPNGDKMEMDKQEMGGGMQQDPLPEEDCDENFGEIIKKSMVETVSA